jgi:hypothetical protein
MRRLTILTNLIAHNTMDNDEYNRFFDFISFYNILLSKDSEETDNKQYEQAGK